MPDSHKPFVVKKNTWTGAAVAVLACIALLGFLFFGINNMSDTVTGDWLRGQIVKKEFRPFEETLISFGSQGVKRRESKGSYLFEVEVKSSGKTYWVSVDEATYRSHDVRDQFKFLKPRPKPQSTPQVSPQSTPQPE